MTDKTGDARSNPTDFWTGLVLSAVGLAFAVGSWQMPRLEERGINPLTVPGIVPGVLGTALCVLGLILALRRYEPSRGATDLTGIVGRDNERVSLAIAFGLNAVFALVLVGLVPFWLATFLYMAAFMAIFGLAEAKRSAWRKRAALILVVSSAMTAGIVYLFGTLFFVRLP
jgi:putative tricarboxylic transport membrane protein